MTEWFNNPVNLVAVLSVVGLVFAAGQWVGRVNSHISGVGALLKEIRFDIKELLGRLPPVTVAGDSPLRLTDLGNSISETLDVRKWARRTASTSSERLCDKPPYDIQDFCFRFVKQDFIPDQDQSAQLRMCAYENGLELDKILDVLAIELRDEFLRQQKLAGLGLTEADISDAVAWARSGK